MSNNNVLNKIHTFTLDQCFSTDELLHSEVFRVGHQIIIIL